MGRYDDIFVEGIATFQQPKNKKKQAEIAMKQFDPKSVCLNALNIAADFGFPMNGTEDDIEKLEAIFRGLHVDFENGNLAEPKLTNAVIIFGVYLGQLLLDLRHFLRGAAVGDSQVVPLVLPAPLDGQGHQLVDDLMTPPDLGNRLELSIRRKGEKRLDLQQHSRRGGDFADASALLEVFQRIH